MYLITYITYADTFQPVYYFPVSDVDIFPSSSLRENGVAVVERIIPPENCAEARSELLSWISCRAEIDPHDNGTWARYSNQHLTMSPTILGMMNAGPICASKPVLKVRRLRIRFPFCWNDEHIQLQLLLVAL